MSLLRLAPGCLAPDAVIAEQVGAPLRFERWQRDIVHNAARLRQQPARRAALLTRDAYWFAVGLLALLHADCEVVLPPSNQADGLLDLADLVVGDERLAGLERVLLLQ